MSLRVGLVSIGNGMALTLQFCIQSMTVIRAIMPPASADQHRRCILIAHWRFGAKGGAHVGRRAGRSPALGYSGRRASWQRHVHFDCFPCRGGSRLGAVFVWLCESMGLSGGLGARACANPGRTGCRNRHGWCIKLCSAGNGRVVGAATSARSGSTHLASSPRALIYPGGGSAWRLAPATPISILLSWRFMIAGLLRRSSGIEWR